MVQEELVCLWVPHASELGRFVDGECCSPHRQGQRLSLVLMHPQNLSQRDKTNQTKRDVKHEIIYEKCRQSGNQEYIWYWQIISISVTWVVKRAVIFTSPLQWGSELFRMGSFLPRSSPENPIQHHSLLNCLSPLWVFSESHLTSVSARDTAWALLLKKQQISALEEHSRAKAL